MYIYILHMHKGVRTVLYVIQMNIYVLHHEWMHAISKYALIIILRSSQIIAFRMNENENTKHLKIMHHKLLLCHFVGLYG